MDFTCIAHPECLNYDCPNHMVNDSGSNIDAPVDMMFYRHCVLYTSDPQVYESPEYQDKKAQVEAGTLTLHGEVINGG